MYKPRAVVAEKEAWYLPIEAEAFDRGVTGHEESGPAELEFRLNPSTRDCKCCEHPDIEEVDAQFITKLISGKDAAERLGVSPSYYSIHIHRDVQRAIKEEVASSPIVQDAVLATINKVGELGFIFGALVDRAKLLMNQPLNAKAEFRIKAIASEARAYAELLLKLEGELKDSPLVVINNLNIQFKKVVELVMEEAPPTLKRKIVEAMKGVNLENYR